MEDFMESVARKIKPCDLGEPKIKVNLGEAPYSHKNQTRLEKSGVIYMVTWNATQTFNTKGQPNDQDNDK
jgi:hypothetical protein